MMEENGFVADTKFTINQNINKQSTQLSIQKLSMPSKSLSYHNLSCNTLLPKCTKKLLGLGSNSCVEKRTPPIKVYKTFSKLNRSTRLRAFANEYLNTDTSNNYDLICNPKLYITTNFQPPRVPTHIKNDLNTFKVIMIKLTNKLPTTSFYNLTKIQRKVLRKLRNNNKIVILDADKNVVITVMNSDKYANAILTEHLNN